MHTVLSLLRQPNWGSKRSNTSCSNTLLLFVGCHFKCLTVIPDIASLLMQHSPNPLLFLSSKSQKSFLHRVLSIQEGPCDTSLINENPREGFLPKSKATPKKQAHVELPWHMTQPQGEAAVLECLEGGGWNTEVGDNEAELDREPRTLAAPWARRQVHRAGLLLPVAKPKQ